MSLRVFYFTSEKESKEMKRFTGVTGIAIVLFIATTASAAQQRTPNDPIHLGDEQQRTPNDPIRLGDEQQEITLDKIVVTPLRYAQQISKIASSLTVITQQEVIQSHASGIVGLLREKTNLMIQDWYGNTAKANVGSRGFGENDGMNTLVLIDGRRTNAVDLSGVDWTQIPLHQVERIEII
ncbi:MAG: TonB-dependent receptor, partial [Candidatus Omnitrophica bacterium]|nr:TonB-dependent receptor [Candidatus Omnitrophota bacterium]